MYRGLSRWSLALRFAAMGALAGVAAWVLALGLHSVLEASKPTLVTLMWAMSRGALVGILLSLILHYIWHRSGSVHK